MTLVPRCVFSVKLIYFSHAVYSYCFRYQQLRQPLPPIRAELAGLGCLVSDLPASSLDTDMVISGGIFGCRYSISVLNATKVRAGIIVVCQFELSYRQLCLAGMRLPWRPLPFVCSVVYMVHLH